MAGRFIRPLSVSSFILIILAVLVILSLTLPSAAQKISVGSYEVESGVTFTVPVVAYSVSDIAGIDVALSYDPAVVNVQAYQLNGILSNCFNFDNIDNSKGLAKLIVVCTDEINAQRLNAVDFTLEAIGSPGDQTELKISANFSDTNFKVVVPETEDGYVKILVKTSEVTPSPTPYEPSKTVKTTPEPEIVNETEPGVGETPFETPEVQPTPTPTPWAVTTWETETPEPTPTVTKTPGESIFDKLGNLFKIPGFEVVLALFALFIAWGWRNRRS